MGKRPDHGGLPAGKRQQRQHRPPLEPLERSVGMRLLAGEIRDHRRLTVILLGGGDAGVLAHERIGAIGADHEPAADAAAVAQLDRCGVCVDAQPRAARARLAPTGPPPTTMRSYCTRVYNRASVFSYVAN